MHLAEQQATALKRDPALQAALMSVYYHSLGRRLELSGAPVVLLPPAVRPTPIERALHEVRRKAWDRRYEVLWTMLRSAPPPPLTQSEAKQTLRQRYAEWMWSFAEEAGCTIERYDEQRRRNRCESNLLAAALLAHATGERDAFEVLKSAMQQSAFAKTVEDQNALGDSTLEAFLDGFAAKDADDAARELSLLQRDVGVTLPTLVNDFADCLAFLTVGDPQAKDSNYRAYPMTTRVVQDSHSLTTTVTVTTLARAPDRGVLTKVLDPLNWDKFSDAFREVTYVKEELGSFEPLDEQPEAGVWRQRDAAEGDADPDLKLREVVKVPSGLSPTVIAEFENVLRITRDQDDNNTADLKYSLYRSCNSRYLWDQRPGGILLDQGFIKVRRVVPGGNTWRVTIRKVLRFADRTPSSWGDTPLQFGQSLNYLAPAALSWWLQSDLYAAERYAEDLHRKQEEEKQK